MAWSLSCFNNKKHYAIFLCWCLHFCNKMEKIRNEIGVTNKEKWHSAFCCWNRKATMPFQDWTYFRFSCRCFSGTQGRFGWYIQPAQTGGHSCISLFTRASIFFLANCLIWIFICMPSFQFWQREMDSVIASAVNAATNPCSMEGAIWTLANRIAKIFRSNNNQRTDVFAALNSSVDQWMLSLLTGAIHKIVASETIVKKSNARPVWKT